MEKQFTIDFNEARGSPMGYIPLHNKLQLLSCQRSLNQEQQVYHSSTYYTGLLWVTVSLLAITTSQFCHVSGEFPNHWLWDILM